MKRRGRGDVIVNREKKAGEEGGGDNQGGGGWREAAGEGVRQTGFEVALSK